jgi:hypothetical protein
MDKCPKCGADESIHSGGNYFTCDSYIGFYGDLRYESWKCLRRQLAAAQAEIRQMQERLDKYSEQAKHDDGEIKRLREELAFYADEATWDNVVGPDGEPNGNSAWMDQGDIARSALNRHLGGE